MKRVVLAEYFVTDDGTLLFIVRDDLAEPYVEEIPTRADELRRFALANFGGAAGATGVRSLDLRDWQARCGPFVEPLGRWADEGDLVWLVPHDVLHALPLHALQIQGRYLLDRNPVCYTPSASVMPYCQRWRRRRGRHQALVLGDSRGDLFHARQEAAAVAELLGTTPFLGDRATKSLLLAELAGRAQGFDVLHLACHGYFDRDQALRSGIVLAAEQTEATAREGAEQGALTAEEILRLEVPADLVTLSACESGINDRRPGDELLGITRALIHAGAPSVLVTLWAVDDYSTSLLVRQFYSAWRGRPGTHGRRPTKAEALQTAQRYLMELTAEQVIEDCAARLSRLPETVSDEQRVPLLVAQARAHAAAGNVEEALAIIHSERQRLVGASDAWTRHFGPVVELGSGLQTLLAAGDVATGYRIRPFAHPYYWAPFILVGDWE